MLFAEGPDCLASVIVTVLYLNAAHFQIVRLREPVETSLAYLVLAFPSSIQYISECKRVNTEAKIKLPQQAKQKQAML